MKLFVTSNFSFSPHVFHSCIFLVRQNAKLCANGLTLYSIDTCFKTAFENKVGKGEIALDE